MKHTQHTTTTTTAGRAHVRLIALFACVLVALLLPSSAGAQIAHTPRELEHVGVTSISTVRSRSTRRSAITWVAR